MLEEQYSHTVQDFAIRAWQEHTREVYSVDWSNIKKDTFASSSWDGLVKIVRHKLPESLIQFISVVTGSTTLDSYIASSPGLRLSSIILSPSSRCTCFLLHRWHCETFRLEVPFICPE